VRRPQLGRSVPAPKQVAACGWHRIWRGERATSPHLVIPICHLLQHREHSKLLQRCTADLEYMWVDATAQTARMHSSAPGCTLPPSLAAHVAQHIQRSTAQNVGLCENTNHKAAHLVILLHHLWRHRQHNNMRQRCTADLEHLWVDATQAMHMHSSTPGRTPPPSLATQAGQHHHLQEGADADADAAAAASTHQHCRQTLIASLRESFKASEHAHGKIIVRSAGS
jgi:hypothetical protein